MWSFIGNKKRQRWLWYAWEPRLKQFDSHVVVLSIPRMINISSTVKNSALFKTNITSIAFIVKVMG